MKLNPVRVLFGAAVMVVAVAGTAALLSRPANASSGGFEPCPVPPCAAACVFGVPPTVQCKLEDGGIVKTTFACCCCGGSGNSFRPLK